MKTRLGSGKKGFAQLEPDKQIGVMIYWGLHGKVLKRTNTWPNKQKEEIVDVNTMAADLIVNDVLRYHAMMVRTDGKQATDEELGKMMEGVPKFSPNDLRREHEW
ncbi:MAG: hypothetical protein AABX02_03185 [archaeon]